MNNRREILPTKLGIEPIIEALFEFRFEAGVPASNLLPALLLSKLTGGCSIDSLPTSAIPFEVRAQEVGLRYAPTMRITWKEKFSIFLGDRVVIIACHLPYPGWSSFKEAIMTILDAISNADFIGRIERYSLKYVDFFDDAVLKSRGLQRFNVDLRIGKDEISDQFCQLKVENPIDENFVNVLTIVSSAISKRETDVEERRGAILDVDMVAMNGCASFVEFIGGADNLLEHLHSLNKKVFFSCLSDELYDELQPVN